MYSTRCSNTYDLYNTPDQSKKSELDNNVKDEEEEDQPSKEELEAMKDTMFTAFGRMHALLENLTKDDGTQKEERNHEDSIESLMNAVKTSSNEERFHGTLVDDELFQPPPPRPECPVCLEPMPYERHECTYQPCCGKVRFIHQLLNLYLLFTYNPPFICLSRHYAMGAYFLTISPILSLSVHSVGQL